MENTRYRVLLIEDDKLDQIAFERLIEGESLPYDYAIAKSVSEAQNMLASQQFDIVITDYFLGDGTAFEILDLVKNIPIIFITGAGNEEIAVNAWKAGAYDYLTKDMERNYLKTLPITVENAIRHKKAEQSLRLLSGAIMSTVDSVYITDMGEKITFVNKAFCDTYGYKKEEILGKDSSILWLTGPKTANTRTVFRTQGVGGAWEMGFYHRRKDGSIFPVSLSRSIIKDSNGNKIAVVGTARDITEHVLVEDELRRTNLKLKEQDKLKSELTIKVSQALMRLLSAGNMEDGRTPQTDAALRSTSTRKNLETARRIIDDFLNISLIDAGEMELQPIQFSLNGVVSEVVEALSPFAERKDIEIRNVSSDRELVINGDRDRIKQALTDFISNSINSASAGGHVEVCLKDIGNEITVEIKDDGPGIESDRGDKIFDVFEWITEQPCWCQDEDLSLALTAAKKIVEIHGGWIWMESADCGRGNTLCLSLPKSGVKEKFAVAAKDSNIVQRIVDSC